jgi:putative ABC transport system permease protein
MKLWMIFKQSIKAIFANKGRSFLTILGIIIGIGSVIALIALGEGASANISSRIATLGTTNLTVMPGSGPSNRGNNGHFGGPPGGNGGPTGGQSASTLTTNDLKSLSDNSKHPQIKAVSGSVSSSAIFKVDGQDQRSTVLGTSVSYFAINNLSVNTGRLYNSTDIDQRSKVVVLGSQLVTDLYKNNDPIGKTLTIENDNYQVIGVLKQAEESGFGNPNTQVYIPYTAAMDTFKVNNLSTITVQAQSEDVVDQVKSDVQNTLLANHDIKELKLADFSVNSPKDLLSTVESILSLLTSLLAGIAAISLLVGGIGIMNIMLVSVTERTREIGLRKAVGAKTRDILVQFIIESVLLTLTGGILGIGLGFLISTILGSYVEFTPIITMQAILLAVGVSISIALIFGIYPAAKAARLNPIDALRYE